MGKIFIVEDHDRLRRMLTQLFLYEKDIEVCGEASNGFEALELIDAAQPDLALVDLSLPEMSGIVLIKEIKERWPHIKCVVFSGHSSEVYAEQAKAAGAITFISKDNVQNLIPTLQQIFEGSS